MPNPSHIGKKSLGQRVSSAVRLKIRIRIASGDRRFVDPVVAANGKLRPLYAMVEGKPEHHPEGVYVLRYMQGGRRIWDTIGPDPQLAVTAKLKIEHSIQATALGLSTAAAGNIVEPAHTDLDEAVQSGVPDLLYQLDG